MKNINLKWENMNQNRIKVWEKYIYIYIYIQQIYNMTFTLVENNQIELRPKFNCFIFKKDQPLSK